MDENLLKTAARQRNEDRGINCLVQNSPAKPGARRERRRRSVNAARRRYWWHQADAFRTLGLTTRGTVRKYNLWPELAGIHSKKLRRRLRQRLVRAGLIAAGFTIRGRDRWTPKERAWRQFRTALNIPQSATWS